MSALSPLQLAELARSVTGSAAHGAPAPGGIWDGGSKSMSVAANDGATNGRALANDGADAVQKPLAAAAAAPSFAGAGAWDGARNDALHDLSSGIVALDAEAAAFPAARPEALETWL